MRVLIVGGGGREHALAWKIAQSPLLQALYCAPGNPGMDALATCLTLVDNNAICDFAKQQNIDLVVVGPEQPLVDGLADQLHQAGVACFGPSASAARLEGSKAFAKAIMDQVGIPTAAYQEFDQFQAAMDYVDNQSLPVVVKADGLAAGKGVTICENRQQAEVALRAAMVDDKFGAAGNRVVIEECLQGTEMSFHVISDGTQILPLVTAKDHKALLEGNKGPNTGGMGTCAPNPDITPALAETITNTICQPLIDHMREQGMPFRGVLFVGLMLTANGPKVLEFNVRFGDPETQVMLPLLNFDLLPILASAADGRLAAMDTPVSAGAATCVILASAGYPGAYDKGKRIAGLCEGDDFHIFHAGTKRAADGSIVTNGGRVLGVTAWADQPRKARARAYELVDHLCFDGITFRRDIGGARD